MIRVGAGSRSGNRARTGRAAGWEVEMRALLWVVGVVAGVLVLLGLLLEAVRWLVIIGVIALAAVIVLAFVRGRRSAHNYPNRR
ncbi:hypothetical protein O7605_27505 [Verrucosispora sp. WMMA2121]|uniref:hypothetical protein n=1 Tax=Verrucosispora sp. WMMA2121 TaxID=3015164 RepID=UPI0022B6F1BD|nr:hypothetical protein [Verrucosispora sp. WMMA2121]MCZ7423258.1 hypothetical protein [Verrucosispora sp. WMMA2121]